jgi:molybdenum cofactor synthesis domain-containing protein
VIELGEARSFVLERLTPLPSVRVSLEEALGCVASEPIVSTESVPGFRNSAMDGYALRAADTADCPVRLRVIGIVLAGDVPERHLETGEAMRIMTGALVPEGADAVCMIEETTDDPSDHSVLISRVLEAGQFVRLPGDDVEVGQPLIGRGSVVTGAQIGVLASQGLSSISVHRRPRVGVLSTGDELSGSDGILAKGKIRDSNRPMLLALLRESGFTPINLGIAGDNIEEITALLSRGVHECDAVIATGGVSVGDVDFVKSVLADICEGTARWMQVAMRPGKPFAFGTAGQGSTPIFGLPGNPVSTRVSFEMFVRPALRRLAGHRKLERTAINMVLDCPMPRKPDGKLHLVHVDSRIHDDGRMHIESASRHGSHLLNAVAKANALAMIPDGEGFEPGDVVRTLLLADEAND